MRLLHVTQAYYPFLERGGPTVKVRALARGLAARGHGVTVLSADLGFDPEKRQTAGAVPCRWGFEAREQGVETIYLRTLAQYRSLTWNPDCAAFCNGRLGDFDVAHIYGLYDLIGPCVARGCRKVGLPYVLEPMGMFRPIVRSIWLKSAYHRLIGRKAIEGARHLIATSEQERQELIEGGIPNGKVIVRRNGIEPPAAVPPSGAFRDRWRISRSAKVVLFLGRLVSKKSPDLMLKAFAAWATGTVGSEDSVLVMAGPEEGDGLRQQLERQASALNLNRSVLFTGPLYGDEKWAAYHDADVFVLPSQNENFGNTAAEAVACGTPVLVTDCCGIAPLVDQRAGLVVPHDCAALQRGLAQILDDSAVAERLRAGCKTLAGSLGWAEPVAQMEKLYSELTCRVAGKHSALPSGTAQENVAQTHKNR